MSASQTPIEGEVIATPDVQIRAIRDLWDGMQESVLQQSLEIGRRLIALKAVYPDRWGRLFSDERRARSLGIQTLPFSQSKANVLMKISRHPVLTDSQHAANLPGDYTTLHTLSRLPEPDLKKAIKTGKVKPAMSRAEAGALVRKLAPQEAYSGSSRQSPTPAWVSSEHAPKPSQQAAAEKVRPSTDKPGDFAKADAAFAKNREGAAELASAWSSVCKDADFPFSAPLAKLQNLAEQTAGAGIGGMEWLRQDLTQREFALLDWFLEGRLTGGSA